MNALYHSPIRLPQYWYVFSTASDAKFQLKLDNNEFSGNGIAHMEKNWGEFFPKSWIWAQYADKETQIVLAGGDTGLALPSPPVYMMFIRTKINDKFVSFRWSPFDMILPSRLKVDVNYCQNEVQVFTRVHNYNVHVQFKTQPSAFTEFLCPTPQGFRSYSVESFASNVSVHFTNIFGQRNSIYGSGAALEFGGDLISTC